MPFCSLLLPNARPKTGGGGGRGGACHQAVRRSAVSGVSSAENLKTIPVQNFSQGNLKSTRRWVPGTLLCTAYTGVRYPYRRTGTVRYITVEDLNSVRPHNIKYCVFGIRGFGYTCVRGTQKCTHRLVLCVMWTVWTVFVLEMWCRSFNFPHLRRSTAIESAHPKTTRKVTR